MKAKFIPGDFRNAYNYGHKLETVSGYVVMALKGGKIVEAVTARFYMARHSDGASPVRCALWVHGDADRSGKGNASGYGYHKESGALDSAITSAGITLHGDPYGREADTDKPCNIHGYGEAACEHALTAIAKAAGYRGQLYIVRH